MNKGKPPPKPRNWVAKHAIKFCKPARHKNKKKDYQRTPRTGKDWGFCLALGNPAIR